MERKKIAKALLKIAREVLNTEDQEKEKALYFEKLLSEIKTIKIGYYFIEAPSASDVSLNLTSESDKAAGQKKKEETREHKNKYQQAPKDPNSNDTETLLDNRFLGIASTELKKRWAEEKKHYKEFYPRKFVKDILDAGIPIQEVERSDDKIAPKRYGFDGVEATRSLISARIMNQSESSGLKFNSHSLTLVDATGTPVNDAEAGSPVDVYTTLLHEVTTGKLERVYIKFFIRERDLYFHIGFNYISFHPSIDQTGVKK